ncbi:MAG: DUF4157 domain-containing protein [bacterium]|nr:DUF4157 domain-containing protein [bacterium]
MRMPDPAADGAGARAHKVDGATLRRQTDDDEEDLQMKPIDGLVQRKCAECEAEEEGLDTVRRTCATCRADNHKPGDTVQPLAAPSGAKAMSPHSETGIRSLGGGKPLPGSERAFFEPRFGRDLSKVRVHTGARANEAAGAINARAFALGSDIVFAGGAYRPGSIEGRRLMAHELAHVGQQEKTRTVRRYCSDPDFCTAYPTSTEADEAEEAIWDYYMIFEGAVSFGTDVRRLYESYLNRSPGDSLAPKIFQTDGAYVHDSFRDSGEIEDDMDAVLELVENRLSRGPGYPWRSGAYTVMSLTNFLSASEMENRPINFSNPFSVAGHIAGGIGSSDAGDDYRKITRANVGIDRTVLFGDTGYYTIRLIPHYEVFDAIDFCPGDCGSPLEQLITIPMSRLEASGRAYDKPFKVIFSPEPRTTRSWF